MNKFESTNNDTYDYMKDQLWSVYFDTDKHNCIGIIELSKQMFENNSLGNFDKNMPLAYIDIAKLPENEEAKLNIICDLIIISACPNMFLLLQAIHEQKSSEIIEFYFKSFNKFKKAIQSNNDASYYESLERFSQSSVWTSNNKGYLINQYGQKVARFIDPNLAKWVSLIGSQFSLLSKFKNTIDHDHFNEEVTKSMNEVNRVLRQLVGNEKFDQETNNGLLNIQKQTKSIYLELKKSLDNLDWDIYKNLKNMEIFLE